MANVSVCHSFACDYTIVKLIACYYTTASLLVTLENFIDDGVIHLLCQKADKEYNWESAQHGDGTTVDGIDRVTHQHVDDRQTNTPKEAGPYAGGGDATPIETKHEGSEECTSQCSPRNTHQLGDERWWIQGDKQGDGDEKHNQYAHHHDFA